MMDSDQNNDITGTSRYEADKKPGNGNRLFFWGIIIGALTGVALVLSFLIIRGDISFADKEEIVSEETESRLAEVNGIINTYYYKDVNDEDLQNGVVKGFVEGLDDPYSRYMTKEEYEQVLIDTYGNYAGIGATLTQDKSTKEVSVVKVYDDSPAKKAGIEKGDIIVSAGEYTARDMELSDFVQHIRGEKGTPVSLVILHKGEQKSMDVVRDDVIIPSVDHRMLDDEIGYIIIGDFAANTKDEFVEALDDLRAKGAKAIVYDLRDNTGGLVDSVTQILDVLLPEGTLVYMLDNKGKKTEYTSEENSRVDMPAAVLMNSQTASASEIFAGAVRDFDYATLIGTKTFGKGVVQNTLPLSDGGAVRLTIATYYTPKGECIHEKGIEPDIELEYEYTGDLTGKEYQYDKDSQVKKAMEVLKKEIKD